MSEREQRRTAYHEAGHAVAADHFRKPFRSVTIRPSKEYAGFMRGTGRTSRIDPGDPDLRARSRWEKVIMVALAGPMAERRAVGRLAPGSAADDSSQAKELGLRMTASSDEATAYLRWLVERVKGAMAWPGYWPRVEAVAQALLERESLTRAEVGELVRAADKLTWQRVTAGEIAPEEMCSAALQHLGAKELSRDSRRFGPFS